MKSDLQLKADVSDEVDNGWVTHDAAIGTAFSARGVSRVVDHLRVGD